MTEEQEKLVEDNIMFVYHMVNKLHRTVMMEYEELVSVCMEGLVKAAKSFNPSRGKFTTFAGRIMELEAIKQDRTWKRKSKEYRLGDIRGGSGNDYENSMEEQRMRILSIDSPEDKILNNIVIRQAIINVAPMLSERDLIILSMLIDDPKIKQRKIGDVIGVSQVHVSRLIREIQNKITMQMEG